MHKICYMFGTSSNRWDSSLKWGGIAVLLNSYWSRGLVLRVLAREKNLRGSICFKLTNECWKTFSENYGKR